MEEKIFPIVQSYIFNLKLYRVCILHEMQGSQLIEREVLFQKSVLLDHDVGAEVQDLLHCRLPYRDEKPSRSAVDQVPMSFRKQIDSLSQ